MIKQFTYLLLFLIGVTPLIGFSQDYERIDATILLYPKTFEKAEDLSKFISRDFTTDEEKVRAMYSWIIQNIAYEPDEYKQFDFKFKKLQRTESEGRENTGKSYFTYPSKRNCRLRRVRHAIRKIVRVTRHTKLSGSRRYQNQFQRYW